MKKYEVVYKHLIERTVTCIVEAETEDEAEQKARDGEYEDSDEDCAPEQGLEITIESVEEVNED